MTSECRKDAEKLEVQIKQEEEPQVSATNTPLSGSKKPDKKALLQSSVKEDTSENNGQTAILEGKMFSVLTASLKRLQKTDLILFCCEWNVLFKVCSILNYCAFLIILQR